MKSVNEIIHSESFIKSEGYGIENNIIKEIDINVIAHFGNIPCLTIICENICAYAHYNNTSNLGHLIKALVEFLGCEREDGIMLSKIRNIPCRIIFEGNGTDRWGEKAVGIGHYMKDRFILFEEFSRLGLESEVTE